MFLCRKCHPVLPLSKSSKKAEFPLNLIYLLFHKKKKFLQERHTKQEQSTISKKKTIPIKPHIYLRPTCKPVNIMVRKINN